VSFQGTFQNLKTVNNILLAGGVASMRRGVAELDHRIKVFALSIGNAALRLELVQLGAEVLQVFPGYFICPHIDGSANAHRGKPSQAPCFCLIDFAEKFRQSWW